MEINCDGQIVSDPSHLVELFGCFFSSVVRERLQSRFNGVNSWECTVPRRMQTESLFVAPATANEVQVIINSLPNKKAKGLDDISVYFIKRCNDILSNVIANLFNISVLCGQFPDALKTALVIPVYKKGTRYNLQNYRPISLLSVISKIMEKNMYNRIDSFVNKHHCVGHFQHGFRRGLSTETAVTDLVQHVYDKVDKNEYVVAIFFDLSLAFDTLRPDFLSIKLARLGLRGHINNWLVSFLSDRKFVVKLDNVKSNHFYEDLGTPQGSVLGPLIFLLYVSDLPEHISEGRVFAYADDTTIVVSDASPEGVCRKIARVVNDFSSWCDRNRLIINLDKTVYLKFRNRLHGGLLTGVDIFGTLTAFSNSVRFLGAMVDSDLNWEQDIEFLAGRLNSAYYAISSMKDKTCCHTLLNIYYGIFYSPAI